MAVHTEWYVQGVSKSREWNTDSNQFTRWSLLGQIVEQRPLTQAELDLFGESAEPTVEERLAAVEDALDPAPAPSVHTHAYAATGHTHPAPDLSGYATTGHTHATPTAAQVGAAPVTHQHAAGDITGLPASDTTYVVSADQAVTVVAQTNLTGLSHTVAQAGTYLVRGWLAITSAAATTGARPNVTTTGTAPATLAYRSEVATAATTSTLAHTSAGTATAGLTTPTLVLVDALVRWTSAPAGGTAVVLQMASEIAGSAVTVRAGSVMTVRKVA